MEKCLTQLTVLSIATGALLRDRGRVARPYRAAKSKGSTIKILSKINNFMRSAGLNY
jgi:hypothetical protein